MKTKWMKFDEAVSAEQPGSSGGGVPAGSDDVSGSDVNWDSLDKEISAIEAGEEPGPTSQGEVEPPTAVPPPPVAPAAVEPAAPAVAPAVADMPAQPAPAAPPVQEQPTPRVSPQELRGQYLQQLETAYGLSEDETQAMLTEPEKILPKLAARVHVNVVDTVIAAVMQNLPQAISTIQRTSQSHSAAEDKFFQAWPQLKNPTYKQAVYSSVAAYRSLNPTAPMDEVIRAAGLNAMVTLRLPIPQELLGMSPPETPQPAPFTPAAPSRGVGGGTPPQENNPFVTLSQEFLEDDKG